MLEFISSEPFLQYFIQYNELHPQKANEFAYNHLNLLLDNQKQKNLLILTKMFPVYAKSLFDTQEGETFVNELVDYSKNAQNVVSSVISASNQQVPCSTILLLLKRGLWICYDEYVLIKDIFDDEICDMNVKNGGNIRQIQFPHFHVVFTLDGFSFSNLMKLTPNKHPEELSDLFDFMVEHKNLLSQTEMSELSDFLEAYPTFTGLLFEKIVPHLSGISRLIFLELLPKCVIFEYSAIVKPFSQKIEMICEQNVLIGNLSTQLERVTSVVASLVQS
eukprot:TRINITY_DN3329_c5_g1_i11.p1 TRINITY_DN3329_c5_g1~~TRINITY_DN3329_c5_g1_i11.p1  ORF type:complete len:276 (-),score=49.18 TRINITY_DN3329_c5_g1_i11:619-1446(-)